VVKADALARQETKNYSALSFWEKENTCFSRKISQIKAFILLFYRHAQGLSF